MAITSFICAVHAGRTENRRQPPESTPISPAQRRIGHGYSKPGKGERKAPCTCPWTLRGGERGFPTSPHSQTRAGQLRGEQACEKGGVITPTGCELSRGALKMPAATSPWGQPWRGAGKARGWGSSALTASSGKTRALSPLRPREFQARADACAGGPLVRSVVAPAGLQLSGPILTATGITEWAPVQVPPQMTSLHSLTRVPPC